MIRRAINEDRDVPFMQSRRKSRYATGDNVSRPESGRLENGDQAVMAEAAGEQ